MAILTNTRSRIDGPKNYFKELKFLLKLTGMSLEGDESIGYKIYSFVVLFLFNILFLFVNFIEVFRQDLNVVANTLLLYQFAVILATVKVGTVLRNRITFGKLLVKLEQEPFRANAERGGELEEKLIKKCLWITYVQTFTYWITASSTVLISCAVAFSSRLKSYDYHDWEFTYGPITVVNVTYSPNYEICFMYQGLSAFVVATQFTSIDLIVAAVMVQITNQLKILQNNMRHLLSISYDKMLKVTGSVNVLPAKNPSAGEEIDGSAIPWKYLKQAIKEGVEYHLSIINIADETETIFSGLLLLIFLSTLGILGVLIFQTSMVSLDDPLLGRKVLETISCILQVAIVCYWGEQIMTESQEVGRAAYESNFVGTDLRFQKSLILIIRRSQNPIMLTAGKFSPICLPTFAWIIQTSYSTFMMLRNMQQKI